MSDDGKMVFLFQFIYFSVQFADMGNICSIHCTRAQHPQALAIIIPLPFRRIRSLVTPRCFINKYPCFQCRSLPPFRIVAACVLPQMWYIDLAINFCGLIRKNSCGLREALFDFMYPFANICLCASCFLVVWCQQLVMHNLSKIDSYSPRSFELP